MYKQFQNAGIKLSDQEHLHRVKAFYDFAYIIQDSNNKMGCIKYLESENEIEIIQFQILPQFQGKGIGNKVLNRIYSRAKYSGKKLKLKVLKNSPAVKFYKKIGFQINNSDAFEFHMSLS